MIGTWFFAGPDVLSGPAALLIFTLSRIFLTYVVVTDAGCSSGDGALWEKIPLKLGSKAVDYEVKLK